MRVASREERDALFRIDDSLLERLRELSRNNASSEDMIALLRQAGVPKPAASLALVRAGVVKSLVPARVAVDQSSAYADWPEPIASVSRGATSEPAARAAA